MTKARGVGRGHLQPPWAKVRKVKGGWTVYGRDADGTAIRVQTATKAKAEAAVKSIVGGVKSTGAARGLGKVKGAVRKANPRITGYEVIEFKGTGDPMFGGGASDKPLLTSGEFAKGTYRARDIAVFKTEAQAKAAAAKAKRRSGSTIGIIPVRDYSRDENPDSVFGKAQWVADFKAGWAAAKRATKYVAPKTAYAAARVSKKHGAYWMDGYAAFIDYERGAYNEPRVKAAARMGLVERKANPASGRTMKIVKRYPEGWTLETVTVKQYASMFVGPSAKPTGTKTTYIAKHHGRRAATGTKAEMVDYIEWKLGLRSNPKRVSTGKRKNPDVTKKAEAFAKTIRKHLKRKKLNGRVEVTPYGEVIVIHTFRNTGEERTVTTYNVGSSEMSLIGSGRGPHWSETIDPGLAYDYSPPLDAARKEFNKRLEAKYGEENPKRVSKGKSKAKSKARRNPSAGAAERKKTAATRKLEKYARSQGVPFEVYQQPGWRKSGNYGLIYMIYLDGKEFASAYTLADVKLEVNRLIALYGADIGVKRNPTKNPTRTPAAKKPTAAQLATVKRIFTELRAQAAKHHPALIRAKLVMRADVYDSPRHFAWFKGSTIAIAPELAREPLSVIRGVLMHEFGHMASTAPTERGADKAAEAMFAPAKIYYDRRGVETISARGNKRPRPAGLR